MDRRQPTTGNNRSRKASAEGRRWRRRIRQGKGASLGGAVAAAQQQIARPVTAVQSIVVVQNKYTQANRGTHTSKRTHTQ